MHCIEVVMLYLKHNQHKINPNVCTHLQFRIAILLTIHFWHAPLGVHITKRRHQSPECTILNHVNCFNQGEVIGFQVLLDSIHPRRTRASWRSPPVHQGGSC